MFENDINNPRTFFGSVFYILVNPSILGLHRTVGEGESQARIDEENPGEIIKEKEGKEGPLKGSTENLNLALATTEENNIENGNTNGNLSPSPIKESASQQQINGGSPTKDGKDTPV